ncbi:GNAT family N-acetyltransferase, partial [Actinomycetota bacterium]
GETVRERLERTRDTTRRVTTVARHIESGRLVGFSELVRNHPADPVLDTSLTVVDPDHRGHGIGKRMKADVILRAITRFPDVTHIRTRNASSNTHMLRINDAIGFAAEHAVVAYQAPFATIDDYLAHRSASE